MINGVTMKICVDDYILRTLKEDINDEDVSTNAVMPVNKQGSAQLICKDDGVICGLDVFFRTFRLLDDTARFDCAVQDGDRVQKGQLLGTLYGDIKAILSGERTGAELPPAYEWHCHHHQRIYGRAGRLRYRAAGHPQDHTQHAPL